MFQIPSYIIRLDKYFCMIYIYQAKNIIYLYFSFKILKRFYCRMIDLDYDDKHSTITDYFAHIEKLDNRNYILLNKLQILLK